MRGRYVVPETDRMPIQVALAQQYRESSWMPVRRSVHGALTSPDRQVRAVAGATTTTRPLPRRRETQRAGASRPGYCHAQHRWWHLRATPPGSVEHPVPLTRSLAEPGWWRGSGWACRSSQPGRFDETNKATSKPNLSLPHCAKQEDQHYYEPVRRPASRRFPPRATRRLRASLSPP
jgi:hypothetical protein